MKPIKLVMSAFGPYATRQEIDFSSLPENLFIITGDTGAGKTMIFDAICFALYGESSGGSRSGSTFRCDKADPKTITFAELEFEYHGKRYFIHREPEQMIAKKVGEGLKSQKPSAFIEGDDIASRITKISDVNQKVREIIGLDCDQFRMTMMIAQGQFAELIKADTNARKGVFRTILGTGYLDRFVNSLREKSKELQSSISDKRSNLRGKLASIELPAPEIHAKLSDQDCDLSLLMEQIGPMLEEQKAALDPLSEEMKQAKANLENSIATREKILNRNKEIQQFRQHKADFEAIQSQKEEFDGYRKDIALAEKSAPVHQKITEYNAVTKRVDSISISIEATRKEIESASKELAECATAFEAAEKQYKGLDELKGEKTTLEKQLESFKAVDALAKDAFEAEKKEFDAKKARDESKDAIAKSESRIAEIEAKWKDFDPAVLVDLKHQVASAEEKERSCSALADRLKTLERLKRDYETAVNQENKALTDSSNARKAWESAYSSFLHSQAGLLARGLEEGTPCPVCGSLSHPSLASTSEAPSEAEVDALRKKSESAESDRAKKEATRKVASEKRSNELSAIKEEYLRLSGKELVDEDVSQAVRAMQEESKLASAELKKKLDAQSEIDRSHSADLREKERLSEPLQAKKDALVKLENALLEAKSNSDKKKGALEEKKKELSGVDKASLQTRLTSLSSRIAEIDKAYRTADKKLRDYKEKCGRLDAKKATFEAQKKEAVEEQRSADSVLKEAIRVSGFATSEDAIAHYKDDASLSFLRGKVATYDQKAAAAKSLFESDLAKHLDEASESGLEEFDIKVNERKAISDEATSRYEKALGSYSRNLKTFEEAKRDFSTFADLERKANEISALYNATSGTMKGSNRVDFETYCMLSTFDQILRIATRKFLQMSDGRYEFRRRTSSSGNGRQGLDIDIFDHYSGNTRFATSLSGGEQFEASLALALSFSEAIQQSAGGVELDSMFIDEGFGTLSPDYADRAIKVLKELGRSNKLIGVISHIEQLDQQIDTKIRVLRSEQGVSYAKIVA